MTKTRRFSLTKEQGIIVTGALETAMVALKAAPLPSPYNEYLYNKYKDLLEKLKNYDWRKEL